MSDEPANLVLELLRQIRADMATKKELAEIKSELKADMHSLRADMASDFAEMQAKNEQAHKQTREQVVGLRRAVVEYHSAVIGHGIIFSEPEARMRRVEQHLNLPSMETH